MANVLVAVAETTAGAMADNVLAVMLLFKSIVATVVVTFILVDGLTHCVLVCLCWFVRLFACRAYVPRAKPVSNK